MLTMKGLLKNIYNIMIPNARCSLVILFAVCLYLIVQSQDTQFSQFYAAKFNIAPSFAGTTDGGRGTIVFRDQWPLLNSTYITYGFAIDYAFPKLGGGFGLFAMQDYSNGGGFLITHTGVQYSYAMTLNPVWQFLPGLQVNSVNGKINLDDIVFGSQLSFDGTDNHTTVKVESNDITIYEAAVSVLFNSDMAWFGAKIEHVPLSKKSFSGELYDKPIKFITFGGVCLKTFQGRLLNDLDYLYLSYLFKYQDKFKQLDLGLYWSNKTFELGLWYRGLPFFESPYGEYNNSALIFKAGMVFKNYRIGYSYDHSLSKIGTFTGGAHEVSTVVLFNQREKKKQRYRMVPSPKF